MQKIHLYFLAVISLSFLLVGCGQKEDDQEITKTGNTPDHILNNYQLVWQDEFEGQQVDESKWNYRAEGSTRHYAKVSRETIETDGEGNVLIKVLQDEEGNYFVGQLGTEGIFETRYGYFECRARMNDEIGPHVAFWLQSPEINKVGDPATYGTEIDIFEYHRKTPGMVHHNLHWDGYGEEHKNEGVKLPIEGIDEGFHTFGLEWTRDEYIFYVNGQETWRTDTAVSQREEYMILSTELTGFGGEPQKGNFPDEIAFDFVRVFKKKN